MAPPLGLTCAASSATPSSRRHREPLRGERFVQLDHIHLLDGEAHLRQDFPGGGHGSHPHDARSDAGDCAGKNARSRCQAMLLTAASDASKIAQAPSLTPDAFPAVTVPSGFTMPLSFASSRVVSGRGCSSCENSERLALFLRNANGSDFFGKATAAHGVGRALLAS